MSIPYEKELQSPKGSQEGQLEPLIIKMRKELKIEWKNRGMIKVIEVFKILAKHAGKSKAEDEKSPDLECCCHER